MSVFDRLVGDLSHSERRNMLNHLKSNLEGNDEPIEEDASLLPGIDLEKEWESLGFFGRFFLWLKSIFQKESIEVLFAQQMLQRYAGQLERGYPGIIDYKAKAFIGGFAYHVLQLKKVADLFLPAFNSLSDENRKDFITFLAGMELADTQERILTETDPFLYAEQSPSVEYGTLKKDLEMRFEEILETIPPIDRQRMYIHSRAIQVLQKLARFRYGKILSNFPGIETFSDEKSAAENVNLKTGFNSIKKSMLELVDILFSLPFFPNMRALEALALFHFKLKQEEGAELNLDHVISSFLSKAGQARTIIVEFRRYVPIERLAKLITENFGYEPTEVSGGEDWFLQFRQVHIDRIEKRVEDFLSEQRKHRLIEECIDLLKLTKLPETPYRFYGVDFEVPESKYYIAFSLIKALMEKAVLRVFIPRLKPIHLTGEFYKPQNKGQFTDTYNGFISAWEELKRLEGSLISGGEFSNSIKEILEDKKAPFRIKRIDMTFAKIDEIFLKFIQRIIGYLQEMQSLLHGIRIGTPDGAYDTLSNYAYIGGAENKLLKAQWKEIEELCAKYSLLMLEILS
jgi:hypothetical protein